MTARTVLITGAAGFVGRWLAAAYLGAESRYDGPSAGQWRVVGTSQHDVDIAALDRSRTSARDDLAPVTLADVDWRVGDLRASLALEDIVRETRPDVIVHLAGIAAVMQAASDPGLAVEINVGLTARLLAAVSQLRADGLGDPIVIVAGSAEQYGRHDDAAMPLGEHATLAPRTVYGATKLAAEVFAAQAARTGVRAVVARLFNHTGPGQEARYLLPALAARALALRGGPAEQPFLIGNTDSVRDLLHVRDVVAAYIALAARGTPGEAYNVASGHGLSTGALAERVMQRVGVQARLVQDPALVRPAEIPRLIGDASKVQRATGWAPRFSLDDLLDDLLDAAAR